MVKEMLTNEITLDNFGNRKRRNCKRRLISGITGLTSMLFIMFGLIVSMCDTADYSKQATTMLVGAGIMLIGVGIGYISMEVQNGR